MSFDEFPGPKVCLTMIALTVVFVVAMIAIGATGCTPIQCVVAPPQDCPASTVLERVEDADPSGSDCRDIETGRFVHERCCDCYLE